MQGIMALASVMLQRRHLLLDHLASARLAWPGSSLSQWERETEGEVLAPRDHPPLATPSLLLP
jgi:hypothetical protein